MELIKGLLLLMALPFIVSALIFGVYVLFCISMSPFAVVVNLLLYRNDYREASDMELGINFRKFDANGKRIK